MSNIAVDFNVLNQKGSPAWYSDIFANRPTAGYTGRMFISTDTFVFYRDTGTTWETIGGSGSGSITGSGTAGQISYFNGSSSIAGSNNLFWDSTNNYLGINTNVPNTSLDVNGTLGNLIHINNTTTANSYIQFLNQSVNKWRIGNNYNAGANSFDIVNVTTASSILSINSTNNIGIGGSSITGYSINLAKNITGSTTSYGIRSQGEVQSDVTTLVSNFGSLLNTNASAFTLTDFAHHRSMQGTIGSGSAVTNQYGYYADSSMTGATNNFGFYGNIANGTNRWNLYLNGTADNYIAGKLLIGSTSVGTYALDVTGTSRVTGIALFSEIDSSANTFIIKNGNSAGDINIYAGTNIVFNTRNTGASVKLGNFQVNPAVTGSSSGFTLNTATSVLSGTQSASTISYFYANPTYSSFSLSSGASLIGYNFIQNSAPTGGGNTYAFYSALAQSTNAWNIYMSGTAANYFAANVSIGSSTLTSSAALQVVTTSQGFLPPVMTTSQKNAIISPVAGLVVFDSTLSKLCVYNGSAWQTITSV